MTKKKLREKNDRFGLDGSKVGGNKAYQRGIKCQTLNLPKKSVELCLAFVSQNLVTRSSAISRDWRSVGTSSCALPPCPCLFHIFSKARKKTQQCRNRSWIAMPSSPSMFARISLFLGGWWERTSLLIKVHFQKTASWSNCIQRKHQRPHPARVWVLQLSGRASAARSHKSTGKIHQ